MKGQTFTADRNGFYGTWYPHPGGSTKGIIMMLGDSHDDGLAKAGAKWLHEQGCSVMGMSPGKRDYGHHSYPLERFGYVIGYMKEHGCEKIGIVGASTTAMLALIAASYYPEITFTAAFSPSDFVMEGFYQDDKDGIHERPGDDESSVTWEGKPLPYLPFAYRHPEYWKMIRKESKEGGDLIASRKLFDESERRHPLQEEEKIKIEKIRGKIFLIGAEDDVLWDTCRYIRRMEQRLEELPHECTYESWIYEHGTHFVFPQSMITMILPVGSSALTALMFKAGRQYPRECRETREDIDRRLKEALKEW